jgi:hypothetical protein
MAQLIRINKLKADAFYAQAVLNNEVIQTHAEDLGPHKATQNKRQPRAETDATHQVKFNISKSRENAVNEMRKHSLKSNKVQDIPHSGK